MSIVVSPIGSPDGLGIRERKSIVKTVEKDKQGNIVKIIETTKAESGKTIWDWLSLLGGPVTLAILGYWLQQIQQKQTEEIAKEQRKQSISFTPFS